MIEVNNLVKEFKVHKKAPGFKNSFNSLFKRTWISKTALANINLKVADGEIIGLIGANGAGKTTLVKILAGIIHPTLGSIKVNNFDPWQRNDEYRKQISVIMGQKNQLWWDLGASDCFVLLKEIYQIAEPEFKKNLDYLVSTLGVEDILDIQVRRLSLGERMKMELIAAMLHQPKVIFLDEPTIGLDLVSQKAIRNFIANYRKEFKPIIILTSHYMADIEHLCKRIVVLSKGSIVYDGNLDELDSGITQQQNMFFEVAQMSSTVKESIKQLQSAGIDVTSVHDNRINISVNCQDINATTQQFLEKIKVTNIGVRELDISDTIEKMISAT